VYLLNFKRELIRDPDERKRGQGSRRPGERRYSSGSSGESKRTMGRGLLEVILVDAKGLAGNDFLGE
jgi:hypothetical protein